jgi:hypothetical protein
LATAAKVRAFTVAAIRSASRLIESFAVAESPSGCLERRICCAARSAPSL